jgi:hypothetical protein
MAKEATNAQTGTGLAFLVNALAPALLLRSGGEFISLPCPDFPSPALESLEKADFGKLSDIQKNPIGMQIAIRYPVEANKLSDDFPKTFGYQSDTNLNSESYLLSFAG